MKTKKEKKQKFYCCLLLLLLLLLVFNYWNCYTIFVFIKIIIFFFFFSLYLSRIRSFFRFIGFDEPINDVFDKNCNWQKKKKNITFFLLFYRCCCYCFFCCFLFSPLCLCCGGQDFTSHTVFILFFFWLVAMIQKFDEIHCKWIQISITYNCSICTHTLFLDRKYCEFSQFPTLFLIKE